VCNIMNFVFSNPTTKQSNIIWIPVEAKNNNAADVVTKYLEIDEELKMHSCSMNDERMQFWRRLMMKC
jgi:hypothetical protein